MNFKMCLCGMKVLACDQKTILYDVMHFHVKLDRILYFIENLLAFSSVELYSCQTIVVVFVVVIREIEEVEEDA